MSFINDMLSDLKRRQEAHPLLEKQDVTWEAHPGDQPSTVPKPLLILGSMFLGALSVFVAMQMLKSEAPVTVPHAVIAEPDTKETLQIGLQQAHNVVRVPREAHQMPEPRPSKSEPDAAKPPPKKQKKPDIVQQSVPIAKPKRIEQPPAKISSPIVKVQVLPIKQPPIPQVAIEPAALKAVQPEDPISEPLLTEEIEISEVTLSRQELATKAWEQATEAQRKGLINVALMHYRAILEYTPEDHKARLERVTLLVAQKRYQDAMKTLQQGIILYPSQTHFSLSLARLQSHAGYSEAALSTLSMLQTEGDEKLKKLKKLKMQSSLAHTLKKYDLAAKSYRELNNIEPHKGRWWLGLANALDTQQRYPQAIEAYMKAMACPDLSANTLQYVTKRLKQLQEST